MGQEKIVPPCPVINSSRVSIKIRGKGTNAKKYNKLLDEFRHTHPDAKYFLLDGSHKTTAATLCRKTISVLIFQSNRDIKIARKLVERGELMSLSIEENSIDEISRTLKKHFLKHMHFQTVKEKTERMIKDKIIPFYMIKAYKRQ